MKTLHQRALQALHLRLQAGDLHMHMGARGSRSKRAVPRTGETPCRLCSAMLTSGEPAGRLKTLSMKVEVMLPTGPLGSVF